MAAGHTASEIVFDRANSELPFMGLTTFKGKRPVKSEVTVAKNYMTEKELFALRRIVNAFFDMAELKSELHNGSSEYLSLSRAKTSTAGRTLPFSMSDRPSFSLSRICDALIVSALTLSGDFGKVTAKGIPPVSVTCFKNISIAVAIGTPNWDSTISADFLTSGLTLRFSVAVFSISISSSFTL